MSIYDIITEEQFDRSIDMVQDAQDTICQVSDKYLNEDGLKAKYGYKELSHIVYGADPEKVVARFYKWREKLDMEDLTDGESFALEFMSKMYRIH